MNERFRAKKDDSLLMVVAEQFPELSKKKAKGLIDAGFCFVNGSKERFSRTVVKKGALVELFSQKQKRESSIIFADDDLLVLDKAVRTTCDNRLGHFLVHRLDKDTTGVLLLAKNQQAQKNLEDQFRKRTVEKQYLAVVDSASLGSGTVKSLMQKQKSFDGGVIWAEKKTGLYAETRYETLIAGKTASLVAFYPKTGRTHQIRVQAKGLNAPIVGDYVYAKHFQTEYRALRPLLHAASIRFYHPTTNDLIEIKAPMPDDMIDCCLSLFKKEFHESSYC